MAVLKVSGISRKAFLAGLIIAILASSVISVVAMTQLSGTLGLKGEKGDKGDTGATGATGATGMRGHDGIDGRDGTNGSQGPQGPPGVFTITNMSGYLSAPAYNSGWRDVPGGGNYQFVHGLGTTDVIVDLTRNATLSGDQDDQGIQGLNDRTVLRWYNLTNTDVFVDDRLGGPHSIRVMIWIIAEP